jgi:uncharacterized protein
MSEARRYLVEARFYSDSERYVLVRLPAKAITAAAGIIAEISDPFTALIVDKDEVTLIVPEEATEEFAARLRDHIVSEERYRLITIDVILPPDLVGFMALVSTALAEANISVFPYAAYSRDHILVRETQHAAAVDVLEKLRSQA